MICNDLNCLKIKLDDVKDDTIKLKTYCLELQTNINLMEDWIKRKLNFRKPTDEISYDNILLILSIKQENEFIEETKATLELLKQREKELFEYFGKTIICRQEV